jgi:UDP:flavonoid glycosyltransferase YjiC (YdhE family)
LKILFCPAGTSGDVYPLIAAAVNLKKSGHLISVCTSKDFEELCQRNDIEFYPFDLDFKELTLMNGPYITNSLISLFMFIANFRLLTRLHYKVLKNLINEYDCIIGAGIQAGCFSLAEHYKKKYIHIVYSPNWFYSPSLTPPFVPFQTKIKVINNILWVIFKFMINFSVRKIINTQRSELGLNKIEDIYTEIEKTSLLSVNTILFDKTIIVPVNRSIPALYFIGENKLSGGLIKFLETEIKTVYIGFGSMPGKMVKKILNILIEIINELNIRAVVLNRGFILNGLNDNIFIVEYVSHELLFKKMSLVIHHGGAGTTQTAAGAGVPQIIIPFLLDQYYWADLIYRMGIGPEKIKINKINKKYLKNIIKESINNINYNNMAKTLSNRINHEDAFKKINSIILAEGKV